MTKGNNNVPSIKQPPMPPIASATPLIAVRRHIQRELKTEPFLNSFVEVMVAILISFINNS